MAIHISRNRLLLWLAGVALVSVVASFAAAWWHAGPVRATVGPAPADVPYPVEDVQFTTGDGLELRGWYLPAPDERTAIVLLHGRAGSRLSMLPRAEFLRAAGYGCLLYDARAHGESEGAICGLGALEVQDLQAAARFLEGRGVSWIGGLGFSQGAATLLLAAEDPPLDAVVTEASYVTLRAEIDHAFRRRVGLPGWLAGALYVPFTQWRTGVDVDDVRPVEGIARLSCPVLVAGGSLDRSAYARDTRALYEAAHQPKQLWIVEGAMHEDLHRYAPAEYEARILAFFAAARD